MSVKYWSKVGISVGGTAISQLIPIVGSLLIARLYSPASYGEFAAWLAIVAILGVLLTLRLEQALGLVVPEERGQALAAITLISLCCAVVIALPLWGASVLGWLSSKPRMATSLLIWILMAAILTAITQAWQSCTAVNGDIKLLSYLKIVQAAGITLMQIGLAFRFPDIYGLVLGHVFGLVLATVFGFVMLPVDRRHYHSWRQLQQAACILIRQYRRFPLFALPADFMNTFAAQLPVLLLKSRFGDEIAGYYALTTRVLGAPISLLGGAVRDVFKNSASEQFRMHGNCREIYLKTFKILLSGACVFLVCTYFFAEPIFSLLYGTSWLQSGTMAIWLAPMFALRFVSSPLSYTLYLAQKQHVDLVWQVALLAMTYATMITPESHQYVLISYSIGYALLYTVYLKISHEYSK